MYRGIDIDLDAIKRNTAVGRGGGDGERAIGGQSRALELKGRDLREEGESRSGEKWKWRRESEGWPEEAKAESEGEKMSYKHFICQPPTQTHSANQVNEPRLNGCAHNNTVTDPLLFLGFSVDKVGKKARALCL
ncbi:hypothetical protein Q3G72_015705 [Acer saccharum]|nr:hypothetical protein Q3G72_015705 [Acer saccharum]